MAGTAKIYACGHQSKTQDLRVLRNGGRNKKHLLQSLIVGSTDFYFVSRCSSQIDDFQSGCNDPNYHQGTEMILYLLNSFSFPIKKIHGRLSTEDAIQKYKEIGTNTHKLTGWQTSIPFYANLEKYINNSTFHLYTGSHSYREDITDKYNENPQKTIIDLINENQDCSFSIDIDNA